MRCFNTFGPSHSLHTFGSIEVCPPATAAAVTRVDSRNTGSSDFGFAKSSCSSSHIEVHHWGDQTILDLPRPNRKLIIQGALGLGFLLVVYGGAAVGAAYFVHGLLSKFGIDAEEGVWPVLIWSVPIIPVVYFLIFGVGLLIARERVTVSPRILKRIWRVPVGAWTQRIPVGEIEELLSDSDDVILRTDRKTYRVGFMLENNERRWLREAIRYLLVKGPR